MNIIIKHVGSIIPLKSKLYYDEKINGPFIPVTDYRNHNCTKQNCMSGLENLRSNPGVSAVLC
jgi:hypothetical protein